jgi:hypothetical protein
MAVTYAADVKDSRMTAVLNQIDAGSGAGKLEIGTAGMATVLATITLDDPAGSVTSGVLTLTMPQSDSSADDTGTAAAARIRDSDDNDVITGLTVGTGSEDVVLDSVSITAGQTVTISSATITHAA